jgi:hypothetical protein
MPLDLAASVHFTSGAPPSSRQSTWFPKLTRVYADAGLLHGDRVPSLAEACPAAADCWKRRKDRRPIGQSDTDATCDNGCIFMPWVGDHYGEGGICIIGMNLRYGGGDRPIGCEFRVARHQEQALREGKDPHGSRWARATLSGAVAVMRARAGKPVTDTADGDELADALRHTARLQAVKCSPRGGRSSPTAAMQRNCPPRYMSAELNVLRPGVLLVYGRAAEQAVCRLGELDERESAPRFRRGKLHLGDRDSDVFFLAHPAHGGWYPAQRALIESLASAPPAAA